MAGLFVDKIIDKLIDFGLDYSLEYLKDQIRWQTGMKQEFKKLKENRTQIIAVVEYASSLEQLKGKNPELYKWLWKLRDALDKAEDVMDEFEYLDLKEQLTKPEKQIEVCSIMNCIYEILVKIGLRALKIDPTLKRLEEAVHKLDEVSAGFAPFLRLVEKAEQKHQEQQVELYAARETGSSPTTDPIGRDKEKDFVIKWLSKTSNEHQTPNEYPNLYKNISLLSIVGKGGMGKTTLLQDVYKDDETLATEFGIKMWACVSNNFDMKKVIADMLKSAIVLLSPSSDASATEVSPSSEPSLEQLQRTLKSKLNSKKFFLVLDDIWEEEEEDKKAQNIIKWENVLSSLVSGELGGKILVTTRSESVALMLSNVIYKEMEKLSLEDLQDDKCLLILYRYAFPPGQKFRNLMSIAEKNVKKLCGSPLAAKIIGAILKSPLDETHWASVFNYDIGSRNEILPILKLSYIFLPKKLRSCFSFCCTFPQDYEFDKDDLVRMWISLGFILPERGMTIKEAGERYFDILVQKSLFDEFQTMQGTYYYKLHDLLQEMLRVVSTQEYHSIVGDEDKPDLETPETIRHLFVKTNNLNVLKKVKGFKNLRSFIFFVEFKDNGDFVGELAEIFKTLRSIRLLYIYAVPYLWRKLLPDEIGNLIHLRYLRIVDHVQDIQLPRALSNLYHLQFIIYENSFSNMFDNSFSRDMNNFPNLCDLKVPYPGMYEVGKLISLKELDGFYVLDKDGYKIEELENMNELSLLTINFPEIVKDAGNAKLCNKKNLKDLSLVRHRNSLNFIKDWEENMLDKLQPHTSLKKLNLCKFMGVRSASWMSDINLFSNLQHINLKDCLKWKTLPSFWQLPLLKYLYLENMPEVTGFDYEVNGNDKVHVFPSLQVLYIKSLLKLKDWFVATASAYECLFPCLTKLYLLGCSNLQELPALPPKLEELEISYVEWKGSNWLQGIRTYCSISIKGCPNLISLKGHQEMETAEKCKLILSELVINDPFMLLTGPLTSVTSIQKLAIINDDAVISLPTETGQWFLKVKESISELHFRSLKSLPFSLESLSKLQILNVEHVPQLQLFPNMPASLERLNLVRLESLKWLSSSLSSFSLLKFLTLGRIPLQELPDLPPSLCELHIYDLSNLRYLPSCLPSLSSLQKLRISVLHQLRELPDLPSSLCELCLCKLSNLRCLPSCLPNLFSLQTLEIDTLHQLQKLPDLPSSLKMLRIYNCHPELPKRYKRDTGSDWLKIAKIPGIYIC